MRERLDYIDALRGIAILGVIVTHAGSAAGLEGYAGHLVDGGGFGVQLFFLVSAFTIFLTWEAAQGREDMPLRNFLIRRLFRIVPVYWAGIALYTLVFGLGSRGWQAGPELWHYPFHGTLTNIFLPGATSSVVPGGWSISVEVMFYLTAPLWFVLVTSLPRAISFTLVAMLAGIVTMRLMPGLLDLGVPPREEKVFWYRSLPAQAACFGFGMILFFALRDPRARAVLRTRGMQYALLAVLALALVLVAWPRPLLLPRHYLASVACLAGALYLSQVPARAVVNPFTTFVGRISFSAYLLHFLVIQLLLASLPLPPAPGPRTLLLALLSIAVTLPLSWLAWRHYELFWTRQARRVIGRLDARVPG